VLPYTLQAFNCQMNFVKIQHDDRDFWGVFAVPPRRRREVRGFYLHIASTTVYRKRRTRLFKSRNGFVSRIESDCMSS
jgi:hypothetical protein